MNSKGGGISHINDFQGDELRVFRGGLRNIPDGQMFMVYNGKDAIRNYHDKLSYERGFIQHSRSPNNQYFAFHYMYGGFRKFILERFFYNTWYRRNIRNLGIPMLFAYTMGCVGMRKYDNAAYDFYYFSD